MKKLMSGLMVAAALAVTVPLDATAQRGPRDGSGPRMGEGGAHVEDIMRMRDRLELTEDQVRQLDEFRASTVQHRTAEQAVVAEYRSRLAAGEIDRDEFREAMQARRTEMEGVRQQHQERIDAILTEDQRAEVERIRGEARAFQRGRASAMRQDRGMRGDRPGMRGGRGFRDGERGFRGPRGGMRPGGAAGDPAGVPAR